MHELLRVCLLYVNLILSAWDSLGLNSLNVCSCGLLFCGWGVVVGFFWLHRGLRFCMLLLLRTVWRNVYINSLLLPAYRSSYCCYGPLGLLARERCALAILNRINIAALGGSWFSQRCLSPVWRLAAAVTTCYGLHIHNTQPVGNITSLWLDGYLYLTVDSHGLCETVKCRS